MHCDDAPCIKSCPVEGALYKRYDGLVIIDPEKCNACKNCIDVCPYGTIFFNEELNIAQKCTGCIHLLDDGWKLPRCVEACPTQALKFGEESGLQDLMSKAEIMKPEAKTKPRVCYMNIPGEFVAGTVIDPNAEEVISGATCTLTDTASGETFTASTDGFGDFWFENIKEGSFSLQIQGDGKTKTIEHIDSRNSVNLGSIPLT